jgi:hypothetical protein
LSNRQPLVDTKPGCLHAVLPPVAGGLVDQCIKDFTRIQKPSLLKAGWVEMPFGIQSDRIPRTENCLYH